MASRLPTPDSISPISFWAIPQSSSLRVGNSNNYFRGWATNAYAQDDYRVCRGLTLNSGPALRIFRALHRAIRASRRISISTPPMTRRRIVTPGVAGPYSGALQQPDQSRRPSISRRASASRGGLRRSAACVIRGGYSIFFSGSPYAQIAAKLAAQPPFATTGVVSTSRRRSADHSRMGSRTSASTDHQYLRHQQELQTGLRADLVLRRSADVSAPTPWLSSNTSAPRAPIWASRNGANRSFRICSQRRAQLPSPTRPVSLYQTFRRNSIFHAGQVRVTRRFSRGMSAAALVHVLEIHRRCVQLHRPRRHRGAEHRSISRLSAGSRPSTSATAFRSPITLSSPVGVHGICATAAGRRRRLPGGPSTARSPRIRHAAHGYCCGGNLIEQRRHRAPWRQLRAEATGLPIDRRRLPTSIWLAFTTPARGPVSATPASIPSPACFRLQPECSAQPRLALRRNRAVRLSNCASQPTNALNHVQVTSFGTTVELRRPTVCRPAPRRRASSRCSEVQLLMTICEWCSQSLAQPAADVVDSSPRCWRQTPPGAAPPAIAPSPLPADRNPVAIQPSPATANLVIVDVTVKDPSPASPSRA